MSQPAIKSFNQTPGDDQRAKLQGAIAFFQNTLKKAPNDISAMHALGVILCQLGRVDEGIEWYEKALNINPMNGDVFYHYGLALLEKRRFADALRAFESVIAITPENHEAHYNMALSLNGMGKLVEAEMAYRKAIEIRPDYVEALNNLGNLYSNNGAYNEAMDCYRRAMKERPTYVMPYNNMGLTLVSLGQLDAAERHYNMALKLLPDYPEALNNLGIVHRLRGHFSESLECTRRALELRDSYPEAHNNIGNVYKDLGDMQAAIPHYHRAIAMHDTPDYRHNLGLALLAAGQLQAGFHEYEQRWNCKQLLGSERKLGVPAWRGEPAEGKTLLITHEQGFGDTLQFCRYALQLRERGMKAVFEVPAPLKRIIASLGDVAVVARGEDLPPYDLHCPMMSLPYAFGTEVSTIPAPIGYLQPDTHEVEIWKNRLNYGERKFRVGLVWAGSARTQSQDLIATDRRRSVTPDTIRPLLDVGGIDFYSLQKNGDPMPADYGVRQYMNLCDDFADTAAFVANLDLVITVDTAMAHLAGAMGKPVWMLNRFDSCWRWLQKRDDSPWYPTLRQFRQTEPGQWGDVIERIKDALAAEVGKFSPISNG